MAVRTGLLESLLRNTRDGMDHRDDDDGSGGHHDFSRDLMQRRHGRAGSQGGADESTGELNDGRADGHPKAQQRHRQERARDENEFGLHDRKRPMVQLEHGHTVGVKDPAGKDTIRQQNNELQDAKEFHVARGMRRSAFAPF
jgi:hypothetical protein